MNYLKDLKYLIGLVEKYNDSDIDNITFSKIILNIHNNLCEYGLDTDSDYLEIIRDICIYGNIRTYRYEDLKCIDEYYNNRKIIIIDDIFVMI